MIWQLATFTHKNSKLRIGVIIDDHVLTYPQQHTIADLITNLRDDGDIVPTQTVSRYALADVNLVSRVVAPLSIRDFYAFEEHVATANRNRGRDVPSQWYEIPVFYFSNPNEVYGDGDIVPYPIGSQKLDYELEVAAVIGKQGRNIAAEDAENYILGYTIYNDWSARDIQAQEMRVGLGPAKGKDFAQSFGRLLVTPEEIADKRTDRVGVYDLEMVARVNGEERSRGNWQSLHWSFVR